MANVIPPSKPNKLTEKLEFAVQTRAPEVAREAEDSIIYTLFSIKIVNGMKLKPDSKKIG